MGKEQRHYLLWLAVIACLCVSVFFMYRGKGRGAALSPTEDSSQFVTITDAVPDAILEIRYYSTYNFVGERIDGYLQPTALLTRRAADSLRDVMVRHGFKTLDSEWWHFTLRDEPFPDTYFTFPVRQLSE